ncbi:alpha/beta hydrolase [Kineosporia sp. NBRC 101731]|uniref:alpha/beta fold hydrolase n=1 Tax=Kineosporia sp. NBRC 101731 TaxID=3032199 RepID=UPI002554CD98|nr:alpha/beta hydrolase [Kineosporia sp. NBRC 101731]
MNLPDGRSLAYDSIGSSDALPLVFHHGSPGGAVRLRPLTEAAYKHGLRLITFSRPGYGTSTPHPGRSIADVAADVTELLDALGTEKFLTMGHSGGGPHALACAALLPQRCLGAAIVAGVGPFAAPGLDFLEGMAPENLAEFGAAVKGTSELDAYLSAEAQGLATVRPEDVVAALGGLVGPADQAALTGDALEHMVETMHYAVSSGIAGWREDDLAFANDWGFALEDIRVPVSVWQGVQDRMVPLAHALWLADNVPGAALHVESQDGHLSLWSRFGDIVGDLLVAVTENS